MKLNTTALALMLSFTVVAVGCSSKDDPKVPASSAGGGGGNGGGGSGGSETDLQGTWTEKSGLEAWKAYTDGSKTAEEACKTFTKIDPQNGSEYISKGAVAWVDGNQAKTCEWSQDWKSDCKVDGTISGMTLAVADGTGSFTMALVDGELSFVSAVADGKTLSKADLEAQGADMQPIVRISEEQIPEMDKFIHETCNMPKGEPVE